MSYTVTIWGARGSIPSPGPATSRYGGNTSCISVESQDGPGRLVVLDAGSGIRPLGNALVERGGQWEIDLLLTHTHWDHIQGFPFFAPMFRDGNVIRVRGARQGDVDLDVILRQQMHPVVFPVPLEETTAELSIEHIVPGTFEAGGLRVDSFRLRHPGTTLGYRMTAAGGGATFAYVTDNELGPGGRYDVGPDWRAELVRFIEGADLLVHDAMYTPDDVESHRGWGHSCYSEAVALAVEARVKELWLFHHRPEGTDAMLDGVGRAAQVLADRSDHRLVVRAATEGMHLSL
ncbi:MAG: MBL fold metallo-hydrolase [Gemmatimonadales bacterium]|nr:MBL fold metallo-hydrolase [Gemmatimonadales bacterium]